MRYARALTRVTYPCYLPMDRFRWLRRVLSLLRPSIRQAGAHRGQGRGQGRGNGQLLQSFQQTPRLTQQIPNPPSLGNRIPGEHTVLACVLVCLWRAGLRIAAMHAAALPAAHRRRTARAAGAGFGAAPSARLHRVGISDVLAHACASRLASAASCLRLARLAFRLAPGPLSFTTTLACCVTFPTIALPPSATETFCTVMAGSLWLR